MYLQVFWNIQFQDRKFKEGNLDVKTLVSKLQRIPLLLLHKNPTIVTAVNHLFLCLCGHGSIVDYHPMQISSQTSHKSPGPSRLLAEQILIICPDKRLPHWSLLVLYCLWCIYSVSTLYLLCIYSVSTLYLLNIYSISTEYLHCRLVVTSLVTFAAATPLLVPCCVRATVALVTEHWTPVLCHQLYYL